MLWGDHACPHTRAYTKVPIHAQEERAFAVLLPIFQHGSLRVALLVLLQQSPEVREALLDALCEDPDGLRLVRADSPEDAFCRQQNQFLKALLISGRKACVCMPGGQSEPRMLGIRPLLLTS